MKPSRRTVVTCAALVAGCLAVYGQTLRHEFINYDDGLYVTDNARVQAGFSWQNLWWSFTTERALNFHPLAWLSHMLDCQLFGLEPWGHHLTSVVLHAANAVLLFLVLSRMTRDPSPAPADGPGAAGEFWASALVAALFAVHPLHVESVAWVAERKDLLSALFWFGAIGAYASGRIRRREGGRLYLVPTALFALGCMSKPMVVTLPFVLLLLDYWPLGLVDRAAPVAAMARSLVRLAFEKLPLFLLSAVLCGVTLFLHIRGHNLALGEKVPPLARCANAAVVYLTYLAEMVWPADLAVYYPHPLTRPGWQVAGSLLVLLGITGFALLEARRRPYLIVGWLWYVGTLVPVIGLVQSGSLAHADRYTYLPLTGVFIMLAFGLRDLAGKRGLGTAFSIPLPFKAAVPVVLLLMACAIHQARYWADSETLFRRAQAVTRPNPVSHNNLGVALLSRGDREAALAQFRKALELDPGYARAITNVGLVLSEEGRHAEAVSRHREAIALKPRHPGGHMNLAVALAKLGRAEEAEAEYREVLRLDPDSVRAYCNLGDLWLTRGRPDEAAASFRQALEINPRSRDANVALGGLLVDQRRFGEALERFGLALRAAPRDAMVLYNLGVVLEALKRPVEARARYAEALRWNPGLAQAHNNLAGILANEKMLDRALAHYRMAIDADPCFAQAHNNLGRLLEIQGRRADAAAHYQKALQIAPGYLNARLNLAGLLLLTGRKEEAATHLRKVLETDPGNRHAREMISRCEAAASGSRGT